MEANKVNDSHRPPTDGGMAKEENITDTANPKYFA